MSLVVEKDTRNKDNRQRPLSLLKHTDEVDWERTVKIDKILLIPMR